MAKQYKGYKNKGLARGIAVAATAAGLSVAVFGGSIFTAITNKITNRPLEPDNPTGIVDTDTGNASTNPVIQEPSIETEPNYGDFQPTPEETLPDLQEPVIPNVNDDQVVMDAKYIDVLAKLTAMSKDYITTLTGSTPNLTVTGISSANINSNNGEIVMLGQLNVGTTFNNFIATINNANTALGIYNLSADTITEADLIKGLDELLSDENTQFKLQLRAHMQLSNQTEVIDSVLQNRLAELKALNSTEAVITNEIAHIESLLQDTSKLKLSVTLNNRTDAESGYNYSFSLTIHTGKYVYNVDHVFNSKASLSTTALKQAIEEHLDTVVDFKVESRTSSAVNQALYIINQTAENTTTADTTLAQ